MDDFSAEPFVLQERARIISAIAALPLLTMSEVPRDEACPICLVPFVQIMEEVREDYDSAGASTQQLDVGGITRLDGCGHIFCKDDMVEWILGRHGTCPACRDVFLDIQPVSESDNESSDGDYVPGDDEEEEEDDGFLDTEGFEDTEDEFNVDPMDLDAFGVEYSDIAADFDEWFAASPRAPPIDIAVDIDAFDAWYSQNEARRRRDRILENMGLSDGDGSESVSEVELALESFDEQESHILPENQQAIASDNMLLDYARNLPGSRETSEEPK